MLQYVLIIVSVIASLKPEMNKIEELSYFPISVYLPKRCQFRHSRSPFWQSPSMVAWLENSPKRQINS